MRLSMIWGFSRPSLCYTVYLAKWKAETVTKAAERNRGTRGKIIFPRHNFISNRIILQRSKKHSKALQKTDNENPLKF